MPVPSRLKGSHERLWERRSCERRHNARNGRKSSHFACRRRWPTTLPSGLQVCRDAAADSWSLGVSRYEIGLSKSRRRVNLGSCRWVPFRHLHVCSPGPGRKLRAKSHSAEAGCVGIYSGPHQPGYGQQAVRPRDQSVLGIITVK